MKKLKQQDFKILELQLYKSFNVIEPIYDESLITKSNEIDVITINNNDIINSIKYINNEKEKALNSQNLEYKIFKEDEIMEFMYEIVEKIVTFLLKLKVD